MPTNSSNNNLPNTLSKSVPTMDSSPGSKKKFRLFRRKSLFIQNDNLPSMSSGSSISRRRSQSWDNISHLNKLPHTPPTSIIPDFKLRITVEEARHLDMDTDSVNTYAIVRCLNHRNRTQVIKKSSQPNWSCSFDMPLNGARKKKRRARQWKQGILITICSKDRFRSQFLGQVQLPFFDDQQTEDTMLYHGINNHTNWYTLNKPIRRKISRSLPEEPPTSGEVKVKIGIITNDTLAMKQRWNTLIQYHCNESLSTHSLSSLAPPETGYFMPSNQSGSSTTSTPPCNSNLMNPITGGGGSDYFGRPSMLSNDYCDSTPTDTSTTHTPPIQKPRRRRRLSGRKKAGIEGKFHPDVVGVTFLEICQANDLPPEKNLARTSFDMDPFVVVSYGTSTFRTNTVRHNLNPVWNEKLFFHVRHNEASFHLKFTVYDREKFSGNDLVAWYQLPIQDIILHANKDRPPQDCNDCDHDSIIEHEMDRYTFPLHMVNADKWKNRRPTLTIRAKFMPYDQIRKMFWLSLSQAYDAEHTGSLSRLEVQSMLETIGSTITEATIDTFWLRHNKDPKNENDELTLHELVESLESHMLAEGLARPDAVGGGFTGTPRTDSNADPLENLKSGLINMNLGEEGNEDEEEDDDDEDEDDDDDDDDDDDEDWGCINEEDDDDILEVMDNTLTTDDDDENSPFGSPDPDQFDYATPLGMPSIVQQQDVDLAAALIEEEDNMMQRLPGSRAIMLKSPQKRGQVMEKVIRLKECPICHRPNLARRSQMDIITHVATCAANDWTTVDRFLMGNFLTEAYAQRRWFVKLVRKVGYGKYSLGRDNANIIVQDRRTGHLIEEKMSVYVRLGMRLVYKGMKTGIQSKGAQRILTNLTMKQGRRFDSPNSAKEIPAFIKFHNISLSEVWKPLPSFKTFNEFFYRKLRPGSRPPDSPEDPTVAVSPADSRMTAFESVSEATRLWIKGVDFTLKKLLGTTQEFDGGSLAVFRLAPQDYHRFHSPVDGVVTKIKHISGQYYTVNPMAIRTTIDVFGENARTVVWIDSKEFGKVAVVCVGAMLVGSIIITAKVGSELKRTDEMGYFAFGGSTLIVIFEKDKMNFDHDLLDNSDKAVETLVRVGNHIGILAQ